MGNSNSFLLLPVLLMVFANWSAEAVKWQKLLQYFEPVDFFTSLKSVLSGIALGLYTPNRVGEPAGRVLFLRGNRKQAALQAGIGALSQISVTLIAGFTGFFFLWDVYFPGMIEYGLYIEGGLILSVFVLLLSYFNLKRFISISGRIFKKWSNRKFLIQYQRFSFKYLFELLAISSARFLIFSGQFYLLLLSFGATVSFGNAMAAISITFLANTLIPSTTLMQLGVRGSAALFCFSIFGLSPEVVLPAVLLLWVFNVLLPSLAGMYFFKEVKLINRTEVS